MFGLMMDQPLLISSVLGRAAQTQTPTNDLLYKYNSFGG